MDESERKHLASVEEARRRELETLPPSGSESHLFRLTKRNKHVSLVLENQASGERVAVYTLHQVEARKLGERLTKMAGSVDGSHDLVEGVFLGGPPTKDQLLG